MSDSRSQAHRKAPPYHPPSSQPPHPHTSRPSLPSFYSADSQHGPKRPKTHQLRDVDVPSDLPQAPSYIYDSHRPPPPSSSSQPTSSSAPAPPMPSGSPQSSGPWRSALADFRRGSSPYPEYRGIRHSHDGSDRPSSPPSHHEMSPAHRWGPHSTANVPSMIRSSRPPMMNQMQYSRNQTQSSPHGPPSHYPHHQPHVGHHPYQNQPSSHLHPHPGSHPGSHPGHPMPPSGMAPPHHSSIGTSQPSSSSFSSAPPPPQSPHHPSQLRMSAPHQPSSSSSSSSMSASSAQPPSASTPRSSPFPQRTDSRTRPFQSSPQHPSKFNTPTSPLAKSTTPSRDGTLSTSGGSPTPSKVSEGVSSSTSRDLLGVKRPEPSDEVFKSTSGEISKPALTSSSKLELSGWGKGLVMPPPKAPEPPAPPQPAPVTAPPSSSLPPTVPSTSITQPSSSSTSASPAPAWGAGLFTPSESETPAVKSETLAPDSSSSSSSISSLSASSGPMPELLSSSTLPVKTVVDLVMDDVTVQSSEPEPPLSEELLAILRELGPKPSAHDLLACVSTIDEDTNNTEEEIERLTKSLQELEEESDSDQESSEQDAEKMAAEAAKVKAELTRLEYRRRWRERGGQPPPDVRSLPQRVLDENRVKALSSSQFLLDHLLSHEREKLKSAPSSWEIDIPPDPVLRAVCPLPEDTPSYQLNIRSHVDSRPKLVSRFKAFRKADSNFNSSVLNEYLTRLEAWKKQQASLKEKKGDGKNARKRKSRPAPTPAADSFMIDQPLDLTADRPRVRGTRTSLASDAARSEEHFELILSKLQFEEEIHNPELRFLRTLSPVPDMFSPAQRQIVFINDNHRVDDPLFLEYEQRMHLNPWRNRERKIFVDKFRQFGKNFRKIAACLPHKDVYDCIQLYYMEKYTLELRPQKVFKSRSDASLANAARRGRTAQRVPPSPHRPDSTIAAETVDADSKKPAAEAVSKVLSDDAVHQKPEKSAKSARKRTRPPEGNNVQPDSPAHSPLTQVNSDLRKSSSVDLTSSAESLRLSLSGKHAQHDDLQSPRGTPRSRRRGRPESPHGSPAPPTPKAPSSSSLSSSTLLSRVPKTSSLPPSLTTRWTDAERELYRDALKVFGKDFKQVAAFVATKNQFECREFYFQFERRLGFDKLLAKGSHATPTPSTPQTSEPSASTPSLLQDLISPSPSGETVIKSESADGAVDLEKLTGDRSLVQLLLSQLPESQVCSYVVTDDRPPVSSAPTISSSANHSPTSPPSILESTSLSPPTSST